MNFVQLEKSRSSAQTARTFRTFPESNFERSRQALAASERDGMPAKRPGMSLETMHFGNDENY